MLIHICRSVCRYICDLAWGEWFWHIHTHIYSSHTHTHTRTLTTANRKMKTCRHNYITFTCLLKYTDGDTPLLCILLLKEYLFHWHFDFLLFHPPWYFRIEFFILNYCLGFSTNYVISWVEPCKMKIPFALIQCPFLSISFFPAKLCITWITYID